MIQPDNIQNKYRTSEGDEYERDMAKSAESFAEKLKDKTPEEQESIVRQSYVESRNQEIKSTILGGTGCTLAIGALTAATGPTALLAAGFGAGLVAGIMGTTNAKMHAENTAIIQDYHQKNFPDSPILDESPTLKSLKNKIGSIRERVFGDTNVNKPKI